MSGDTIQIEVPKSALVAAFLEKVARASDVADIPFTDMQARIVNLPEVGSAWHGGIFAGVTVDGFTPMALVLLPGDEQKDWKAAGEWAAAQNGMLPSRFDALVLFKHLKAEFKGEYYWTSDEVAGNADSAWIQYFGYGSQGNYHKSLDCRCRAVRRVAI